MIWRLGEPPPVWSPQRRRRLVEARTRSGLSLQLSSPPASARGHARIPPNILDCPLYLYPTEDDARRGERGGGSGFLVMVRVNGHPEIGTLYAVTNSHVIREGGSPVIRLNSWEGATEVLPLPADAWEHHPDGDDLALAEVGFSPEHIRFSSIPTDHFMQRRDYDYYAVGTDTFAIGRLITHEGKQRNTPAARFGNIAIWPLESVLTNRGLKQESFLVEARSLSGYSGSPCSPTACSRTTRPRNPATWLSTRLGGACTSAFSA